MALQQFERQKIWSAVRVFGDRVDVRAIAEICETELVETRNYVWTLCRHGFVDFHEANRDNHLFKLVRDTGAAAPAGSRDGVRDLNIGAVSDVSQRLWNAMRLLRSWDLKELAAHARTPYGTATRYSGGLATSEYVSCCPRDSRTVGSRNRYQLIRETGAIAPLFRKDGSIFDCNEFLKVLWDLKKKSKSSKRVRA